MSVLDVPQVTVTLSEWKTELEKARDDHYDSERSFAHYHEVLVFLLVLISVTVSFLLISSLNEVSSMARISTSFLSVTATAITIFQARVGYKERAERHRLAGAKFIAVLDEIKALLSLAPAALSGSQNRIDKLLERKSEITKDAPGIPNRYYRRRERKTRTIVAAC